MYSRGIKNLFIFYIKYRMKHRFQVKWINLGKLLTTFISQWRSRFLPKNSAGSPWRDKISLAILELQEKGEIQMLYDKWWKSPGDTCMRTEKGKESKANSLGVDNIGECPPPPPLPPSE